LNDTARLRFSFECLIKSYSKSLKHDAARNELCEFSVMVGVA
jgi:hypothetical protein